MKKLCIIAIIIILSLVSVCAFAESGGYETIKLGLFFGNTAKADVTLNSDAGFVAGYFEGEEFVEVANVEQTELYVLINGTGIMEINGIYAHEGSQNLVIYSKGDYIAVNGTKYRGNIILSQNGGAMTVINEVDLEEYLYSVIGKEMSPSWHIEALKAQAICARTYAINNWNKYASYGFNLCTTQMSQVYFGISGETERTIQAVEETRGQIVKYNGKIAQTFFYSSSGGKTANVKYVWGSDFPYLVSVDDPYEDEKESHRNWQVKFTADEIEQKLANADVDVGNVTNVIVNKQNEGTVYELIIKGDKGEYTLKNERTRTFMGLKSQYYTVEGNGAYEVKSLKGEWFNIKENLPEYYKENAKNVLDIIKKNTIIESDEFTFTGAGWGHRIGMSQYGAKAMAENGFTAAEILTHYFPGTTVE